MEEPNRERQSAELVLLQSMYPVEVTFNTPSNEPPDLSVPDAHDPSFTLKISNDYTLELSLPPNYPETNLPTAYLTCNGHIQTSTRKQARSILSAVLADITPGQECLDVLVQQLSEQLSTLSSTDDNNHTHDSQTNPRTKPQSQSHTSRIKTTLLWSHHLLATSKRKDIVSWSRSLRLNGYSRPGYPGAVLIEGEEDDVDEFVSRIKELRWQALQVRGEETSEKRRLAGSDGFGTREVESLGDLAEELKARDKGLAEWFLEGMKIGH
ncbi:hypothetical protein MBLNU457_3382t1 [Dothideomycetes sp. NU457]